MNAKGTVKQGRGKERESKKLDKGRKGQPLPGWKLLLLNILCIWSPCTVLCNALGTQDLSPPHLLALEHGRPRSRATQVPATTSLRSWYDNIRNGGTFFDNGHDSQFYRLIKTTHHPLMAPLTPSAAVSPPHFPSK